MTRRDFLNGTLLASGAALVSAACPFQLMAADEWNGTPGIGDYADANGNTHQVMADGHTIRDHAFDRGAKTIEDTGETVWSALQIRTPSMAVVPSGRTCRSSSPRSSSRDMFRLQHTMHGDRRRREECARGREFCQGVAGEPTAPADHLSARGLVLEMIAGPLPGPRARDAPRVHIGGLW